MASELFPMTRIGEFPISRLVIGSNTFFGFSHFSKARDEWMRQYSTDERIAEILAACANEGLNAVCSGPQPRLAKAIEAAEKATGKKIQWIVTPGGGGPVGGDILDGIRWCADNRGTICMPHTSWTDERLVIHENRIEGLGPVIDLTRKLGMGTGLSTHRPEALIVGEKAGYDLDTYIQPYNSIGFLCSVETDWTADVIRRTPKPVICIKPLGAGRIMPPTGLPFVYGSVKPIDTVCLGMMNLEEVKEDIALVRQILAGGQVKAELQYTRSKKALMPDEPAAVGAGGAKGRKKVRGK